MIYDARCCHGYYAAMRYACCCRYYAAARYALRQQDVRHADTPLSCYGWPMLPPAPFMPIALFTLFADMPC